jgi:hypothetical protein
MGKGLDLKPNTKTVAYAAGTGVLVFMDLIAQLLLQKLGVFEEVTGKPFELGDNFHFELNASFASREEAIGLELME